MTNPKVTIGNFSIEKELQCRCGCERFNYDDNFLIRLQAFRLIYGCPLNVTSGGRCVRHNADEGGVPASLHECETKEATAIDVTGDCGTIYKEACASGLFNEVIYYVSKNIVHLGWDKNQKDNYFKVK